MSKSKIIIDEYVNKQAYYQITMHFEYQCFDVVEVIEIDEVDVTDKYDEFVGLIKFLYVCYYSLVNEGSSGINSNVVTPDNVRDACFYLDRDGDEICEEIKCPYIKNKKHRQSICAFNYPCNDNGYHLLIESIEFNYFDKNHKMSPFHIKFSKNDINDIVNQIKKLSGGQTTNNSNKEKLNENDPSGFIEII